MWVEFKVGSRPFSKRFYGGYSCFLLSSKTSIFKFQFDLESIVNPLTPNVTADFIAVYRPGFFLHASTA